MRRSHPSGRAPALVCAGVALLWASAALAQFSDAPTPRRAPAQIIPTPAPSAPSANSGPGRIDGPTSPPAEGAIAPAPADDWRYSRATPDPAFAAFQRGFFVTALRLATERVHANAHDDAAMTLIGELYKDGLGVRQDMAEALRWYRLAADRGNREALFAMGRAFIDGNGLAKDDAQAKAYFEKAAAKGHGAAAYNLGVFAIDGEIKDFPKAAAYFKQAMEAGDLDGLYSLALLYRAGVGVDKDIARSTELLRMAAEAHYLPAEVDYAIALFNGAGVEKNEEAAALWFTRAAWRNAPVAQNRLARMFAAGRGVREDLVEAMKWHIIARASGLKDAWLESRLPMLTATQRQIVDDAVKQFAGNR